MKGLWGILVLITTHYLPSAETKSLFLVYLLPPHPRGSNLHLTTQLSSPPPLPLLELNPAVQPAAWHPLGPCRRVGAKRGVIQQSFYLTAEPLGGDGTEPGPENHFLR